VCSRTIGQSIGVSSQESCFAGDSTRQRHGWALFWPFLDTILYLTQGRSQGNWRGNVCGALVLLVVVDFAYWVFWDVLPPQANPSDTLCKFFPGRSMQILMLSERPYPDHGGGAGKFAHLLAACLVRRGHVVHLLCYGPGGSSPYSMDGIQVHRVPFLPCEGIAPQDIEYFAMDSLLA